MDPPRTPRATAEARQRLRIVFARLPDAPMLGQREQTAAWEQAATTSGLPFAGLDLDPPRPKIVIAAPLPMGMSAEHELLDAYLTELVPIADVRASLGAVMPERHRLLDLHDAWLGEPALPGQVAAADYRCELTDDALEPGELDAACRTLVAASTLPRTRAKGDREVAYDLRPLLVSVEVAATAGSAAAGTVGVRMRTRFDPALGVGRPEEVIAALGDVLGRPLSLRSIVRERLILASER
jgi:radical SAM-linked protein